MATIERALTFECGGESLIGVVALPALPARTGVLVIVGGPQYRVGSHRQFVLLARHLAGSGVPCMRFDYRGMGDATGPMRSFESVNDDIAAAIDAFVSEAPGLERVVLWGLCDGASAACLYLGQDDRVAGAVLLNPWVRTETGEARTMLQHYYLSRLVDRKFWSKLLGGGVDLRDSMRDLVARFGKLKGGPERAASDCGTGSPSDRPSAGGPQGMLDGLNRTEVPFAVFLSERDYVAKEFEHLAGEDRRWKSLLRSERCELRRFEEADHTFSGTTARRAVEEATLKWLRERLPG